MSVLPVGVGRQPDFSADECELGQTTADGSSGLVFLHVTLSGPEGQA